MSRSSKQQHDFFVCLLSLRGRCFNTCAASQVPSAWESASVCADSPALRGGPGAAAWKVSGSQWKTIPPQHSFHSNYQPAEMPRRPSSGTFSHAAQNAEFYLAAEARSLSSLWAQLFTGSVQEREGVTHHLRERHTEKKRGRISAHLSKCNCMWKKEK